MSAVIRLCWRNERQKFVEAGRYLRYMPLQFKLRSSNFPSGFGQDPGNNRYQLKTPMC